jgi:hypothetical protein
MTLSGLEPAIFRLVAQVCNQLRYSTVPNTERQLFWGMFQNVCGKIKFRLIITRKNKHEPVCYILVLQLLSFYIKKKNSVALSPRANYTD